MATSSLTHNFTLETEADVERFLDALEESERMQRENPLPTYEPIHWATQEDTAAFMRRFMESHKKEGYLPIAG